MRWVSKPVVVDAIHYDGGNIEDIREFVGDKHLLKVSVGTYSVRTLEGNMLISKGDYIIKGVKGEFYPCKPEIFHIKYGEYVESEENI